MIDPSSDCSEVSVQNRDASSPDDYSASASDISHHEVRSKLSDHLDGSLEPAERWVVEAHLETCRACLAFRDTLRQTVHAVDTLPSHRAPPTLKQRIIDRARAQAARVSSYRPTDER